MFKLNIFYQYKIHDMENLIFNYISQNHAIDKTKLFKLIYEENVHPSNIIINYTKHYNRFNNILKFFILIILAILLIHGNGIILISFGFIGLIILMLYLRYIDEQFYNIYNTLLSKLL